MNLTNGVTCTDEAKVDSYATFTKNELPRWKVLIVFANFSISIGAPTLSVRIKILSAPSAIFTSNAAMTEINKNVYSTHLPIGMRPSSASRNTYMHL